MSNTFESLNLDNQLMGAINRLGFKEPTQIQRDSIPLIFKNKDVIGESATGSGKTLAFGAGIIKNAEPGNGIQAIVLVPTRELAEQVKNEITKLAYKKPIKVLAIYGGVSINPQIDGLKKCEIIVATPGRLLDHMSQRTIDTTKVKTLVLDEADRMVEMGFIEDVERIIRACPKNRQTLLFSATMYGPAKEIAKKHMKNPETIHATKMVDPKKLQQTYYDTPSNMKKELLVHLLKKEESDLVIVFCNTRRATDMVGRVLKLNKIKSAPIHGGLTQVKRLKTIELFHKGKFQVLVCTDVAARGLHIEGVTHVYNYDVPNDPSDYVHRIGRTARAGKEGLIINIIAQRDYDNFSKLVSTHRDYKIKKEERPNLKENSDFINDTSSTPRSDNNRGNYGRSNDRSGGYGRSNDRSGGYGRSNDRSGGYGRSNDRSGSYGRSNDRSGNYGRSNDRSSSYGRSNDRSGGYERSNDRSDSYERSNRRPSNTNNNKGFNKYSRNSGSEKSYGDRTENKSKGKKNFSRKSNDKSRPRNK